jgi:DNA helicase-2/ATP-dependent DNA helicase PcrA
MSPTERFAKARKAAVLTDFANLNPMQREAVAATEGPLLLLAGAGSGKTTVIINRIANILRYGSAADSPEVPGDAEEDDIAALEYLAENPDPNWRERMLPLLQLNPAKPWEVLAITFTNKAAGELKTRLEAMLGPMGQDVWASTFHSCCVRILRRYIEHTGEYTKSFTIYDSADSKALLKRIMKDLDIDEKQLAANYLMSVFGKTKDEMKTAADFAESVKNKNDPKLKNTARVYAEYEKRCREANALDFDDLVFRTVRLLTEYKEVREYYQHKFRYVLVDEYQDTNKLQYKLVRLLSGGYKNLCVVGDDDQGIYKFRGATIDNILGFEKEFKNCRVIRLEQNYRSTENILTAANAVISKNVGRKGKTLWTDNGQGETVTLKVVLNERDESDAAAAIIHSAVSGGDNYRDFAVLYRTNAQSFNFENSFRRFNIPHKVYGGLRFFDRAEVKDMAAYLSVVANPRDDLRLLRIINNPPRGIGAKTVDAVARIAQEEGKPLFDVISDCRSYPELNSSAAKLGQFAGLILKLIEKLAELGGKLDVFYDELLDASGYLTMLDNKKDVTEGEGRRENVLELKSTLLDYISRTGEEATLEGYLDEISLYSNADDGEATDNVVSLMTIHSAKGLEFPTVFLVGAEENVFPGSRAIGEPEEMEEERRLCYVALTRAKRKLWILAAKSRMLYGRTSNNLPSRFLSDIPNLEIVQPPNAQSAYQSFASKKPSAVETPPWRAASPVRFEHPQNSPAVSGKAKRPEKARPAPTLKTAATANPPKVALAVGEKITHKAFGAGTVANVTPQITGDVILEIDFGKAGVKKLMQKTAMQYITKVSE